jgi:ubiquinone/menaquinone biosynthesis C-methylase UbiE
MDNSLEMVKVMKEKVKNTGAGHLKPLFFNLETDDYNGPAFDLIYSQMVMHHVTDVQVILHNFSRLLHKGGRLVIADL